MLSKEIKYLIHNKRCEPMSTAEVDAYVKNEKGLWIWDEVLVLEQDFEMSQVMFYNIKEIRILGNKMRNKSNRQRYSNVVTEFKRCYKHCQGYPSIYDKRREFVNTFHYILDAILEHDNLNPSSTIARVGFTKQLDSEIDKLLDLRVHLIDRRLIG